MNKPIIKLIEISGHTNETFSKVWELAKGDASYDKIKLLDFDTFDKNMSADLPTQEYINMIWSIEGMPRAFWDQLDRCRLASFWEQSARVIDLSSFADNERYWTPEQVNNNFEARNEWHEAMSIIQDYYQALVNLGIPVEEARGIIPLYILTRGTMSINLRALKGLIKNRLCFVCQGSYWFPVIEGMLKELSSYLFPKTLQSLVTLPCNGCSRCPIEGSVLQRISGEDPNPVCPLYIEKFLKGDRRTNVEEEEIKRHPNYLKIRHDYLNLLSNLGLYKEEDEDDNGDS